MKRAKRTMIGVGAALVLYIALLAALSALLVRGTVREESIPLCVWLFACAAVFVGAKIAGHGESESAASIAICAAGFWALVQLLGFLACDSLEPSHSAALALPAIVGGVLAYLLRAGKAKRGGARGKHRFRK